jgi:hypothetical protein
MGVSYRSLVGGVILAPLLLGPSLAQADCVADEGDATLIEADGVTVTCDNTNPNPFPDGVGIQGTDTNLTVTVEQNAEIDSSGIGVTLASGGDLDNQGTITAVDTAVFVTDTEGTDAPVIDNAGDLVSTDGAGIDIASGFEDATVENSGSIDAATVGIRSPGGTVDNSGSITAIMAGVDLSGSDFTNSGDIQVTGSAGVGVIASGGSIDNSGDVTSEGEGVQLSAQGSLTNSGSITAESDGVVLNNGSDLDNSGSISSTSGAAIVANGNASISNNGSLTGNGDAILLSGGENTLTLQSGSNITGSIRAVFSGAPDDSLVLDGDGSFDGVMENFGTLDMLGTSWTLSGAVTAQAVSVQSGRLDINGDLDTRVGSVDRGVVSLVNQGVLGGIGTVVADVDNSSGIMAAGATTGTLTIDGNYTQGSGATMRVASDAGRGVGLLRVTGTADIAGVVEVQAGSDGIYDFLTADGGITGEFDELRIDGRALVTLLSTPTTLSIVRASTTVQDNVVYAALDAAVLTLDGLMMGGRTNGESGPWIRGLGHYGDKDEVDGVPGGDFWIYGGIAGFDWALGNFRIGAGGGYTTTDQDFDDGGDAEADNTIYGAYLEYVTPNFHTSLTVSGGSNEFDHERSVFINNVRSTAEAEYDGDTLAARLVFGGKVPLGGEWARTWVLEPEIRADYIVLDLDPYTETGGIGFEFESEDDIEAAEFAGLIHVRRTTTDGLGIAPRGQIGVVHRIAIDDREWLATESATGTSLLLPGDDGEVTSFRMGVGADFALGSRWKATVDYFGEYGDDGIGHTVAAGLKILL